MIRSRVLEYNGYTHNVSDVYRPAYRRSGDITKAETTKREGITWKHKNSVGSEIQTRW